MQSQARHFSHSSSLRFISKFNKQLSATQPKPYVVAQLSKPIGLTTPPSDEDNRGDLRSLSQKFWDFMDREKNRERQAQLEHEIAKSGMYNVHTYRKTGGKFFNAPPAYWKAERALYFANFCGETLASSDVKGTTSTLKGKVSIVRVYTSMVGDKSSRAFFNTAEDGDFLGMEGYARFQKTYPLAQIVDVNITENGLKALFVKMSKGALRKQIHPDRHDKYFIVPRKTIVLDILEQLHMDNTYGGFVYVLDADAKVRWAACGVADESERAVLWRTVRGLQRELKAMGA